MTARSSGTAPAAHPAPVPPAAPGWTVSEGLARLDDRALLGLVRSLPRASQRRAAACELLVTRHEGLVASSVRPYLRSPVPAQDLMQVGYVGLLKAIGNFDPAAGASLATYARQILIMDFRGGMTQAQIGQRLSISQMHVSRLRARALGHLRARLLGREPRTVQGPARRQHPGRRTTMTTVG